MTTVENPLGREDAIRGRGKSRPLYRRRPFQLLVAATLLAGISGGMLGYFMRFDLPDVRALEDYNPPLMTQVMAVDGSLLDTFAEQRRIMIEYGDIPVVFRNALLATEDASFHRHTGIDLKGIARALWQDIRSLRLAQGASTLTQQLARNLFLHPDKTIKRKLQEALLALEIERQYTKQEILAFYCNQIYMGHGRYGLEAAARFYFGRPAREINVAEAAMLAGLIQRPEGLSPLKHPERAFHRRNFVLRRMVTVGYMTPEEAATLQPRPIEISPRKPADLAPYFVEEVRRWLQESHGGSGIYTEGLTVRTTLDPRLQKIAERAVDRGLRELDKRQGWRGVTSSVPEGEDPAIWVPPGTSEAPDLDAVHDGVVVALESGNCRVRVGPLSGVLGAKQVEWTGKLKPAELFSVGDVIRVRLVGVDEEGGALLELEQEPVVEAALIALNPATGAVLALVGGHDFERSEFDRAMQAKRQTGSAFKPLVYAAALTRGRTLAETLVDGPTVFLDPRLPDPYQPENYTNKYYETVTLRTALEKSANISTVMLLDVIGYDAVIDTARRLGIKSDLRPYPSLALGSFETTLLQLTSAYGTFANQGVLVEPHLVEEV